jgi:hypothetical protein
MQYVMVFDSKHPIAELSTVVTLPSPKELATPIKTPRHVSHAAQKQQPGRDRDDW